MGIYDRNYMGDDDDSLGTAHGHRVTAVGLLIGINVAVWLLWMFAGSNPGLKGFLAENFMVSRPAVESGYVHTLITAMFSHFEFWHIFWNMLFFWYLGDDVQTFYGQKNMVWLYIFSGLLSSLAHITMHPAGAGLGASGAIMGIAVVAAIVDPEKPMSLFFIPIKLKWLVVIYIVGDLLGAQNRHTIVGHFAHLGGALAGLLFWKMDLRLFASRGRTNSGILHKIKMWWRARRFRVVKPSRRETPPDDFEPDKDLIPARRGRDDFEPAAIARGRSTTTVDAATSRRVDELLAKIKREGMNALSDEERTFLRESSQKYKKK